MKTPTVLLAIALYGAWALALGSAAYAAESVGGSLQQVVLHTIEQAVAVIWAGYQRAPVLVAIMSALLVLPVIAIFSLTMHKAARLAKRGRRSKVASVGSGLDVPAWPAQAWLSVDGEAKGSHPIAGEMIRIGRHPDNEVWLTDTSVHRYHAVIHRTQDSDFFITDLSGDEGNGVRINGTRRTQSQLADGDVIELGKARMTFASIPI